VSVTNEAIAAEAGLRHVDAAALTIRRRRRGRGFSYVGSRGGRVDAAKRRWIESLALPPAWHDVRISADPDCHLLATGVDDAGRRQYRYHPGFREVADDVKFARIAELGARIGDVRAAVADAIASDDERRQLTGIVVRLIDLTLMRVGSERYADEHETYGASTLRCEHVKRSGAALHFCFTGKSGQEQTLSITDADVLGFVEKRRRRAAATDPLFVTAAGHAVDGDDVKTLLCAAARIEASAKDLRTWGASATMVESLCSPSGEQASDPVLAAYDRVAEVLGNTRTVARGSYVAPAIEAAHADGSLGPLWNSSRSSAQRSRAESTLDKLFSARLS
jgi:DNA topoisomerase-1